VGLQTPQEAIQAIHVFWKESEHLLFSLKSSSAEEEKPKGKTKDKIYLVYFGRQDLQITLKDKYGLLNWN